MKIAFFDTKPFEKEYLEKNLGEEFQKFYYPHKLDCFTEIKEEIKDIEALSVFIESNLSKNVLEKFPNLKYIALRSVGFSHVDLSYAEEKNIKVMNAPHYGDNSIAEYVFGLLLSISRHISQSSLDVKNQNIDDDKYQGVELLDKTIGIIGLGAIGKKVADIALGFSMKPVYYDITKDENYNYMSLDELLSVSDIISINCPLNSSTLHLLDENKFELMKQGVIIINTARGEIIETAALYKALLCGKVKFAALDVVECENILYEDKENNIDIENVRENCLKNFYITRKLLTMKNVLITPHIAYNTLEAKNRILKITVDNLLSSIKFTKEP